ncbi:MAG: ABC transporter substrate-binding protein [Deltaproteobacteria bacterium]|nr:ABC transporter substrate-binding protein [Deltaproteobacteria bacterium]
MYALWTLVAAAAAPLWLGPHPAAVRRVVSLAPSTTEILCAVDACPLLVGVTRYDAEPPEVAALPKIGGFIDPDPEAVLALKPDLALAVPTSGGRNRLDTLARLGVAVLVVPGQSLDDLFVAIDAIGAAVGRAAAAKALATRLRAGLDAERARHARASPVRVLLVVGRRPLVAAGPGTFIAELLGHLNATNVVTTGGPFPSLDLEALAAFAPDVVIDAAFGETPELAPFWARIRDRGVLRAARVVPVTDDAVLRPGPRLLSGLAALGRALRPEAP